MWALRRSSTTYLNFRASGLNISAFRACVRRGPVCSNKEAKSSGSEHHLFTADRWITSKACKCKVCNPKQSVGCRYLSSQVGPSSSGEEDGFSDLKSPEVTETAKAGPVVDNNTSGLTSDSDSESDLLSIDMGLEETLESDLETPELTETAEAELLHDDSASVSSSDSESESDFLSFDSGWEGTLETVLLGDLEEEKSEHSALFKLVREEPGPSIPDALDKYVEGKELSRTEAYQALLKLRRRRLFEKALQVSEWLEGRDDFDFSEQDYASRVYLIAKVRGIDKAEIYWDSIPKSFREKEVVYRSLLANYVWKKFVNKAEQLFSEMKDLGLPITVFSCNRMLLLYTRIDEREIIDERKIGEVLFMMEKKNIKPSLFTYQMLMDAKGKSGDIKGMEQVIETMKANGIEPNLRVKAVMAIHYASAGFKEKAVVALKDIKDDELKSERFISRSILPIHASFGNVEEVLRIWKIIKLKPRQADFFAAIEAFGKLKSIKMAESIFDIMTKTYKNLSTKHYTTLLNVYADNKMLSKAKELVKRMGEAGVVIGPLAWDALVKLYVNVGEVEKADGVLQKLVRKNPQLQPMYCTFMNILYQYSTRGDVHNAERIFERMKMAGYVGRAKPFNVLLQTYIKAKVPPYGIRERMKADKVFPNKEMNTLLTLANSSMINNGSDCRS